MILRSFIVAGLLTVGLAAQAEERSAPNAGCDAPDQFRYLTDDLPFMRLAMQRSAALKVFVVGSASTLGLGPDSAYPAVFAHVLSERLPGIAVSVTVKAKPGLTAAEMVKMFKTEIVPAKPALVVWQTGTVEAMRGVDPESFAASLLAGIELLHRNLSDVILVDMQFSPYTSSMVNLDDYRKLMIWVAQRRDVFLFRRYELMHYWSQNQVFDFGASDRAEQRRVAERIHACIGRFLAEAVLSDRYVAHEPK